MFQCINLRQNPKTSRFKKCRGFFLFQMLLVIAMVVSIAYVRLITENTEAKKAKADRIATQLAPAIQSYFEYSSNQLSTNLTGQYYYHEYDLLSDDYNKKLSDLGYDTTSEELVISSVQVVST